MPSHLCGCLFLVQSDGQGYALQRYLPLLDSESHTLLLSTTSRTTLKQTFTNPKSTIKECTYTFPLYDGVSVVSFICRIGSRTLRGLVKEKHKAKAVYQEAVARGESAGLLEQLPAASDVFSTKLGNIPAGESVIVEIEYIGELKHDTETNGIRFTIPTQIAPRYGSVTGSDVDMSKTSVNPNNAIRITVDVQMPTGTSIQGIQSPSHPIAITLGTVSSQPHRDPTLNQASATLSLGSASLDKDFVLIVLAKETAVPKALLETHPRVPGHRALMVTLVPKFALPPSRPEIVFVADRSGSMAHKIPVLISAMKVFLKSMPVGVKFNICSFGSSHSFLWPQSQPYSKDTLAEAVNHVEGFGANMGGTETYAAIHATIDRRFGDIPLEVMLLTDGDIWQQEQLFRYLNEETAKSRGNIRVFPLGIGNGVSHALIEGVARAGQGFAQTVQDGEKLDQRVVRMLKGALSPHLTNCTLEVKYELERPAVDDFEIVQMLDKVTDSFKVHTNESFYMQTTETPTLEGKKPISLFDMAANPDEDEKPSSSGKDRYADVPRINLPKLIQAPNKIPPLFPFTRTSVCLLMSAESVQRTPVSVILRATCQHGPLELEIPIEILLEPGETIHHLAAKKAIQDLEEGRGWLCEAMNKDGYLTQVYPSKFGDMVEREAVRLGVQFQVAGKWTSFVAVASND